MSSNPTPDPPLDGPVSPALDPSQIVLPDGWRLAVHQAVDSTNSALAELARTGTEPGLILATEHQTKGRGRLDREWQTPAGVALTFSVLLRPDLETASWTWLPLVAGYAVHAALADRLPEASLKWPNDVVIEDRKLAGILVERVDTPAGPVAVIGIGINANQSEAELPPVLPGGLRPTSIAIETGSLVDRNQLLTQVLGSLRGLVPLLGEPALLAEVYAAECSTIGREVDVHLPSGSEVGVRRGTALGVDESGALLLDSDGEQLTVSAGDVIHVRRAD